MDSKNKEIIKGLLTVERNMIEAIHCFIGDYMNETVTDEVAIIVIQHMEATNGCLWEACA